MIFMKSKGIHRTLDHGSGRETTFGLSQTALQASLVARVRGNVMAARQLVASDAGTRESRVALAQGLPVPRVVAVGEFLGPWGAMQSFLAIEELSGMISLNQAIPLAARQLSPLVFRAWKKGLIREIARLARFLHDHHAFHKDFYLCHFFIARADTTYVPEWTDRVFMIDFHRLAHHPYTRAFWISKDLGQLLYSSDVEGIDARDRLPSGTAISAPTAIPGAAAGSVVSSSGVANATVTTTRRS